MAIHKEQSPLAGKTVKITSGSYMGCEFRVEDWWDRVGNGSWMYATGIPVCMQYTIRTLKPHEDLPIDNEVLYGKIGSLGYLVHISEIEQPS